MKYWISLVNSQKLIIKYTILLQLAHLVNIYFRGFCIRAKTSAKPVIRASRRRFLPKTIRATKRIKPIYPFPPII